MSILHNLKFKTQISIYFVIVIAFLVLVIMQLLQFILKTSYRDQAELTVRTQARQIAINLENKMDNYSSYLELLLSDRELIEAMERGDRLNVEHLVERKAAEFINLNAGKVRSVRVYSDGAFREDDVLKNAGHLIFSQFVPGRRAYQNNELWTGTYLNSRNEKVFSLFKKAYQTNRNHTYYLELCIYETELYSFFNEDKTGNRIMLLNDGLLLSDSNREEFRRLLYGNKWAPQLGTRQTMPLSGVNTLEFAEMSLPLNWTVAIRTSAAYLEQGFWKMYGQLFPVILAVMAAVLLFVRSISTRMNRRLGQLQEKIAHISNGDLTQNLQMDGKDEFKILADEAEDTRQKIQQLITQINDINELKRVAEISALRAQINSHFLFNALSSIKWLSRQDDKKALAEAVEKLALFLRYGLSLDENQATLADEVGQLNAYIYLQKLRYGDEINVHMDIEEELLAQRTVKLVLQPLVENAIYHGRRESGAPLNITIYTSCDETDYCLVVEDDGNGIPEETIRAILREDGEISKSGYGLKNVISRVRVCSGGQGEVTIESKLNVYTKIVVKQKRS